MPDLNKVAKICLDRQSNYPCGEHRWVEDEFWKEVIMKGVGLLFHLMLLTNPSDLLRIKSIQRGQVH